MYDAFVTGSRLKTAIIVILGLLGTNTAAFPQNQKAANVVSGSPSKAMSLSVERKAIVIHISTGTKEMKYTATQYAELLYPMFLDSTLAHPAEVLFVVETTQDDRNDAASVHVAGAAYDPKTKDLRGNFAVMHPYMIPKHMPAITEAYYDLNGAYGMDVVPMDTVLSNP